MIQSMGRHIHTHTLNGFSGIWYVVLQNSSRYAVCSGKLTPAVTFTEVFGVVTGGGDNK